MILVCIRSDMQSHPMYIYLSDTVDIEIDLSTEFLHVISLYPGSQQTVRSAFCQNTGIVSYNKRNKVCQIYIHHRGLKWHLTRVIKSQYTPYIQYIEYNLYVERPPTWSSLTCNVWHQANIFGLYHTTIYWIQSVTCTPTNLAFNVICEICHWATKTGFYHPIIY